MTFCLSLSSENSNSHRLSNISLKINLPAGLQIRTRMALKASLLSFFGSPSRPTMHLEPLIRSSSIVSSTISVPFCSPLDKGKPPTKFPLPSVISFPRQGCQQRNGTRYNTPTPIIRRRKQCFSNLVSRIIHSSYEDMFNIYDKLVSFKVNTCHFLYMFNVYNDIFWKTD
jgi:hypothetical protein